MVRGKDVTPFPGKVFSAQKIETHIKIAETGADKVNPVFITILENDFVEFANVQKPVEQPINESGYPPCQPGVLFGNDVFDNQWIHGKLVVMSYE
jgi:hypothetical protein